MDTQKIIEEYGSAVTALCRRMISRRELAEEACQEVWLEIIKSINTFKGASKLSTWIYTITRRTVQKYIHNEKKYSVKLLSDFFASPDNDAASYINELPAPKQQSQIKSDCDNCMTAILHCLDNESRMIYLFRIFSPLNYHELAQIFQKSEAAVRKSYSRSSKKINSFLNKQCYLFNSQGACKCKLKNPIKYSKAKKDYDKITNQVKKIYFVKEVEEFYNRKNLWLKYSKK